MKYGIVALVLCVCGVAGVASNSTSKPAERLVFRNNGFSILPLDEASKGGGQVLMMFLPVSGDFGPNVNVRTQPHAGTLDDYAKLSRKEFQDVKLTILSERKTSPSTLIIECSGPMLGRSLHFYCRAVLKSGTIYLATATATEDQWKDLSGKLKSCVDSLEMLPSDTQPASRPSVP